MRCSVMQLGLRVFELMRCDLDQLMKSHQIGPPQEYHPRICVNLVFVNGLCCMTHAMSLSEIAISQVV